MYQYIFYIFLTLVSLLPSCTTDISVKVVKDDNGKVIESYSIDENNKKHGIFKAFDENHRITEEAEYNHDTLNGYRRIFRQNGTIEIEEHYRDGVVHGAYTVFYPNGGIEISADYQDGKMHGLLYRYYESGEIMESVTMVDNEEHGTFKEYYENGNLQWKGNYVNGENEVGLLQQFNESGDLIRKMQCDSLSICQTIWTKEDGDVKPINVFGK